MFLPSSLSSNIFGRYKKVLNEPLKRRNRLGCFQSTCANRTQECDLDKEVNSKNNISNYLKYEKLRYYANILSVFPVLPESAQRLLEKAQYILECNESVHIQEVNTLCGILKNEYEMKLIQYSKPKAISKIAPNSQKPSKSTAKILHRIFNRPRLSLCYPSKEAPILKSSEIFTKNNISAREPRKAASNIKRNKHTSLLGNPLKLPEAVQDSFSSFTNSNGKVDEEVQHNSNGSVDSSDYSSMVNLTTDLPLGKSRKKYRMRIKLPAIKMIKHIESKESSSPNKVDDHFGKWTLYSNDSDKFC